VDLDLPQLLGLAAALGFASGIRRYAVLFVVGLAGHLGWLPLPAGLQVLQHPVVMGATGLMTAVEFLADKIPAVDSLWDAVHTFIRVPAGMALAAGVFGGDSATWAVIAALMGGALAATSHTAKAATRAAANTSPEPFSNIALSLAGDAVVPGMLWLAWEQPVWFFVALGVLLVVMIVTIVVLFRFLRGLVRRFRGGASAAAAGV
jgi:hypothetical protein